MAVGTAKPSEVGGQLSGGIAVVARAAFGFAPLSDGDRIVHHPAAEVAVEVIVTVCLDVTYTWGSGDRALMASVRAFLSTTDLPFFTGGDFNNAAGSCADLSFNEWLGSAVVAPDSGACRSSRGSSSLIDYAVVT